jgi:magnesium transporter
MFKESKVALICGVVLSIINFFVTWFRCGNPMLALVVALTTIIVIFMAKLIGGLLPILAKKLKLDPAIMASPVITTLLDCISIISYFLIATALLGI